MAEEKFEEEKFMKILVNLKDTQESIQGFSGWCIRNRKSAYKMARCWIKVIKKVRVEQKLVLFYLVNDIVQHSAKRGYSELLEKFRSAIKEAIPHLKDEKIGPKVQRCLDIWEERDIFDKNYLQDLSGLIDLTPVKEDQEVVDNFQPPQLCTQIKILKALEDDADYKLKNMKENELDIQNIEEMKLKLKDKHCGAEFVQEFEDGTKRMEQYIKAMEREIRKRRQVIEMLGQGKKYYESVFGEAEIVATAYNNFGNRVTKVKSKLTEKIPELANAGVIDDSPVPSPDYDAPSPEGSGDEMEIKLPDEGGGGEDSKKVTNDLNSRLSGINYDSFQTPNKEGGGGYSISEFLTKMAHGEDVDVDSFISGGNQSERKRKHVSGSGYDPSTGGMFDTPQPRARDPWSDTRDTPSQPPVPDLLAWDEDHEVENLALARLKQAANKNNKNNTDNGVHSSNLVNLTGSPGVKLRKLSGGGGSRSDMDVSDDDHSDLRDSFLDSSFPPPVRDSWDAPAPVRDAWDTPSPVQGVSPWENGHAPTQPPPPTDDRFSAPPPVFPHPPGQNPGFNNGNHDRSNPPPFSTSRGPDHSNPPPFSSSGGPDHSNPPPFSTSGGTDHGIPPPFHSSRPPPIRHDQPEGSSHFQGFDSQDSGLGRGNFRPNRGFGHRGNDNHSPRFPGAPGSRFPGPQGPPGHQRGGGGGGFQSDRFSDSDSQDGERGGMRGGRGSFRGGNFHKDFDKGSHRGGFDRGRGGGSRGWNGARRPWNNRGGGGGGRGGGRGGNW